ncbi:MAG: glycosyltransferase, partial [Xanthobacteraceae bacterium]|nr:glycosyltransferase [Xanthobacteraceae bacterium]
TTRPHYLKYSLASVLAQDDPDIEVVIAFNPPNPGVQLGDLGNDPRIKIVTAPRFLPMHDNWDNGFINTTGEWVTLLGDDDCYVPHAVGRMRDAVARVRDSDMLLWTWGSYIAPDCPLPKAGYGSIPSYSGAISSKPTAEVGELLYGFKPDMKKWLPSIMRGAVRREYVAMARKRSGYFCHPLTPDYGAAAQIIALAKRVTLIDLPLVILQTTRDSMAASSFGVEDTRRDQLYGIAGNPAFVHSPLQARLETNSALIYETLMAVKAKYPELDYIKTELVDYLKYYYQTLLEIRQRRDISKAFAEFEQVMSRMTAGDRAKVFAAPSPWPSLATRLWDRITKRRGMSIDMAGRGDMLDFVKSIGVASTAR